MKISKETIKNIPEKEQSLLKALIEDLEVINANTPVKENILYIDWQDFHDMYSPERIDPCPDYYGMYTLRRESSPNESVGVEMSLAELDDTLCFLYNYILPNDY